MYRSVLQAYLWLLAGQVLWSGRVLDPAEVDSDTVALRTINTKLVNDERVDVSMLVIGDGTTLLFKR